MVMSYHLYFTLIITTLLQSVPCLDVFDGSFKTLSFHPHNGTTPVSALKYSMFDFQTEDGLADNLFQPILTHICSIRDDIIHKRLSQSDKVELEKDISSLRDLGWAVGVGGGGGGTCTHPPSCTVLAMILDTNVFERRNVESEVLQLTKQAAELGHPDAQSNYAYLIEQVNT
jgi:hypothetical protein